MLACSTDGSGRKKRQDYAEGITYSDIFHNYPPGLKVRKDVANFVSSLIVVAVQSTV